MAAVSGWFCVRRRLGVSAVGSHTQTARVRELRKPVVVILTDVVRTWISWDSSKPADGSRLSAERRPHVFASIPSVVAVLLRVNCSFQKKEVPLGGDMQVESDGVHIVAMRPGKAVASGLTAPVEFARYTAYGRELMEAMWPTDLERITFTTVGVRDGRVSREEGWSGGYGVGVVGRGRCVEVGVVEVCKILMTEVF